MTRPIVVAARKALPMCVSCGARQISVCGAIPEADLARLASAAVPGSAMPRTTFVDAGEEATSFFNITSGTAKLYKLLPDGRSQIVGFVGAGHFIGLANSDCYLFSAEAISTVRYCQFSRKRLRALLDDFPSMERRLLQIASHELIAAQEQMLLLGQKNARERIASFLVSQSRVGSSLRHSSERFALPMTRGDIADYLGMTIETVVRTLKKLRAEGMIEIVGTVNVVIRNRSKLQGVAEAMH